eukprot:scaffold266_cov391-Prasinococcus_capsulatus_cf.AAC.13
MGQLGSHMVLTQATEPILLDVPEAKHDEALLHASPHVLRVCSCSESLYAWGNNDHGQLGVGHRSEERHAVKVALPVLRESAQIALAVCGGSHSLLLTDAGEVYSWGSNAFGQLGIPKELSREIAVPQLVPAFTNEDTVASVCAGFAHSMALTNAGMLYAFGDNSQGQLGIIKQNSVQIPTVVESAERFTAVVCGHSHTIAIAGGKAYAWGLNEMGQLGLGHIKSPIPMPTPVVASGTTGSTISLSDDNVTFGGAGKIGALSRDRAFGMLIR